MSKSPEYFVRRPLVPDCSRPQVEFGPAARAAMEEIKRLRSQLPREEFVPRKDLDQDDSDLGYEADS